MRSSYHALTSTTCEASRPSASASLRALIIVIGSLLSAAYTVLRPRPARIASSRWVSTCSRRNLRITLPFAYSLVFSVSFITGSYLPSQPPRTIPIYSATRQRAWVPIPIYGATHTPYLHCGRVSIPYPYATHLPSRALPIPRPCWRAVARLHTSADASATVSHCKRLAWRLARDDL